MTTNNNEWQGVTRCAKEWQRVTASDTKSDKVSQRMTVSGTTNENEWYAWEQVQKDDFSFRMKQNIQCTNSNYSAIQYILSIIWEIDDLYFQYNILGFNIQESLHLFCYHFCQNLLKHVNIVVKSELLSGNNILIKSSGIPQKENW